MVKLKKDTEPTRFKKFPEHLRKVCFIVIIGSTGGKRVSLGWNGYHENFFINFAGISVWGCHLARNA